MAFSVTPSGDVSDYGTSSPEILVRVAAASWFTTVRCKKRSWRRSQLSIYTDTWKYLCVLSGVDAGGSVCQQYCLPIGKHLKENSSAAYSRQ